MVMYVQTERTAIPRPTATAFPEEVFMMIRRALVAAAATAAIAPAALLAAPAAFAGTDRMPGPTATETGDSGTPTDDPTDDPTVDPTGGPSGEPTAGPTDEPTDDPTAGPTDEPTDEPTDDPTDEPTDEPTDDPTDDPTDEPTTGPTAEPTDVPTDPTCEEASEEAAVTTELRGLPSKVVAGSGWVPFTFRTTNTSDKAMKSVDAYVQMYAISKDELEDVSKLLTVQSYDEDTSSWKTIGDDEAGYFASIGELKSGEYADAKLRLKVDAKTPGSYGFGFAIGAYHNEDDVCGYSEATEYEFDVLVAGSKPGPIDDAEGKPGDKGSRPAPQGGGGTELSELPVSGRLAETGSSSALPMIGLIGGVAMAVGGGAVFVVRGRRSA
jgi:hypothetical protein